MQGEGVLAGTPMVFVRLGGCSVGCVGCDTDYRTVRKLDVERLASAVVSVDRYRTEWVWVTGGEPTDHDLAPLVTALRAKGYKLALATAGTRKMQEGLAWGGFDFLSVSPHRMDDWVQRSGSQLNVVPGLHGLRLEDVAITDVSGFPPGGRFVTPLVDREGRPSNLRECLEFVRSRPGWRLGYQVHKWWGMP